VNGFRLLQTQLWNRLAAGSNSFLLALTNCHLLVLPFSSVSFVFSSPSTLPPHRLVCIIDLPYDGFDQDPCARKRFGCSPLRRLSRPQSQEWGDSRSVPI